MIEIDPEEVLSMDDVDTVTEKMTSQNEKVNLNILDRGSVPYC